MPIDRYQELSNLFDEIHMHLFNLKDEDANPDHDKTWRDLHILLSEAMRRSSDLPDETEPLELVEEVV